MRVLVTNDDGIYAEGLWALARAMTGVGEVWVVAPDRQQSGVGTSVTLHSPVRAYLVTSHVDGVRAYCVEGTPSDCVILAIESLVGGVDLVVSGINEGANLGNDTLISGTVAGALQGHFYNIPSIAISVASLRVDSFDAASRMAVILARRLADDASLREMLLNVNLPNMPLGEIEGVEITQLGRKGYQSSVEEGYDGARSYYWIVRRNPEWDDEEGTDTWAVNRKRISITPIQSDLSDHCGLSLLDGWGTWLFDALQVG